jgi:hypothetical protein
MTKAAVQTPKRRLGRRQLQKLDLLALYTSYTPMTGFRTLLLLGALGLAEMKARQPRWWRITHDGMIVLKQNGYYPADESLRSSVRDPRVAPSKTGARA